MASNERAPRRDRLVRQLAAKRSAQTRAENKAALSYYERFTKPTMDRVDRLVNSMIAWRVPDVILFFDPGKTGRKLKHGVERGVLVSVTAGGRLWRVLPDGYKRPQTWSPLFWRVAP